MLNVILPALIFASPGQGLPLIKKKFVPEISGPTVVDENTVITFQSTTSAEIGANKRVPFDSYSWSVSPMTNIEVIGGSEDSTFKFKVLDVSDDMPFSVSVTVESERVVGNKTFKLDANDTDTVLVKNVSPPLSTIHGTLTEADFTPAEGINIQALSSEGSVVAQSVSDAAGAYQIMAEINSAMTLKLSADDYADQIVPVTFPSDANQRAELDITMIKRGDIQILDISSGGEVIGEKGASVKLPPASFLDVDGNIVVGSIDVTVTPVDTSDSATLEAFPGAFVGISQSTGAETAIASLGTVEYTFSQNGNPLQLSPGTEADIVMPVYNAIHPGSGEPLAMGDQIELWSLNEVSGIWEQEGFGQVVPNLSSPTGLALAAKVSHFTWWNIDVPIQTATAEITVTSDVGGGTAEIFGSTTMPGFRTSRSSMSIGNRSVSGEIPAGADTCFRVEYSGSSLGMGTTDTQCINDAASNQIYPLNFHIVPAEDLVLNETVAKRYAPGEFVSIGIRPRTPETSVNYSIASGTLPTGVSLSSSDGVNGLVSGYVSDIGDYTIIVNATDSLGYSDQTNVTFDVSNGNSPIIYGNRNPQVYALPGETVTRRFSAAYDPISWVVTNSDGSPPPANVSITNDGLFSLVDFDGLTVTYPIRAYNADGPSFQVNMTVKDATGIAPRLASSYSIPAGSYRDFDRPSTVVRQIPYFQSYPKPTSWTVTNADGTTAPSTVTITDDGMLSITNTVDPEFGSGNEFYDTFLVTAYNGSIASNAARVRVVEAWECDYDNCI